MKIIQALFLASILLAFATATFAYDSEAILENGNPKNRINIVFLGDGYQESELDKYRIDVENLLAKILSEPPFSDYNNYFNAYRVDVISQQSGADRPKDDYYVDTALDSSFSWGGGPERLVYADATKVYKAAQSSPVPATPGMLYVVVNDSKYGGGGGSFSVSSTNASAAEVSIHELGHSFGKLADEYDYGADDPTWNTGYEPNEPNVTIKTTRDQIKWRDWLANSTDLPTEDTTNGVVGLYEGAYYRKYGIYRPTFNSKMRSLNQPYHSVNSEQLIKRIYNFVSPVDSVKPAAGSAEIPKNGFMEFVLTLLSPSLKDLEVEWLLNDEKIGSGLTLSLSANQLNGTNDTLTARVKDPTQKVIRDSNKVLEETLIWDIHLAEPMASEIYSPEPNATIFENSIMLNWETGAGIVKHHLDVGTMGAGSNNLYSSEVTGTTTTVSGLPSNGFLYVRLWSIGNSTQYKDYVYILSVPEILTPQPGTKLSSDSMEITWNSPPDATGYIIQVGTYKGEQDLAVVTAGAGENSVTIDKLPTDGRTLYVSFYVFAGKTLLKEYTYTAYSEPQAPTLNVSFQSNWLYSTTTLSWQGAEIVDIYRNLSRVAVATSTNPYTVTRWFNSTRYNWKVCLPETQLCSETLR